METIFQQYNNFVAAYGTVSVAFIALIAVLFCVQFYYFVMVYGRIPKYRIPQGVFSRKVDGISVIVVVRENYNFLEQTLPVLLTQEYDNFEIVVVDVGSGADFHNALQGMKLIYPNLTTTKFEQDPRFPISNKMALNVGIKAARNEYILITTADSVPVSGRWLSLMAKGFTQADVVLGYCGVERKKGLTNALIRSTRLMMAARYLASATRGVPYRGMIQNFGLTRSLYFSVRGFDHLNMNIGEDDLFVQRIANSHNTAVVMHPHTTVVQSFWGGLPMWRHMRRFYGFTVRFYPGPVRRYIASELTSRMLFTLTTAIGIIILPAPIKITLASTWFVRLCMVEFQVVRIGRRLGEHGLMWAYILHDMMAPFDELQLWFAGRLRTVTGIWR